MVKPKPYTGFVEFSIAIFKYLVEKGATLVEGPCVNSPSKGLLVAESYPRSAWKKLGIPPLPGKKKSKESNIEERLQALMKEFNFRVPRSPTHDELCALVAGLAGVAILANDDAGYIADGSPPK